jgi:3-oxoacyl-[acyl-carrier-protein] synthase-3
MGFTITGTGSALPAHILTNDEISKFVDTSDEWISTRTGISSRPVITTETASSLAALAGARCLESAGVSPSELDLIICSTISGDYLTPSLACVVQKELGAGCPAFDINAACSGFIYALDIACGYLETGRAGKVLVLASEIMSKLVDWNDRATCVLFGDGCGAVLLEPGDGLMSMKLTAQGNTDLLVIPHVSGNCPLRTGGIRPSFLKMKGQEVYKFAVGSLCRDLSEVILQAGIACGDVDFVLPHQANRRIVEAAAERLGIPQERYVYNIQRQGNTSSASIPIMLDELNRDERLEDGNILAMAAFGGGLTTGACVIRWKENKRGLVV